jgi:serine/threonine-protein kinase
LDEVYASGVTNEGSGDVADATLHEFASGQKLFGRYTLIKILGRGGMGIVWLARDEELEREVALKFFPDLIIRDSAALSELKRETKRCLELTHPHIVRVYDFVHDERSGCISMEYIDGETLASLRCQKEQKVFEPGELSVWVGQLCDALHYAHHRARIIHRDLKSANLMVNRRGNLKVSDFGIARSLGDSLSRLTMEQQQGTSGTLVYMSPQQLDGERGTPLDDIYSLGATCYDLLTSKPPFYSGNIDRQVHERVAPSMTERRKEFDIEPALLPPVWEETVGACLAKDPAHRPQSALEVAQRLQLAPTQAGAARLVSSKRTNKLLLVGAGIAALLLLTLGGWYLTRQPSKPIAAVAKTAPTSTAPTIPEKSIAVLPFENLSEEKANAFFADGVQDEILTNLARVADLKVISRTSVIAYRDTAGRNLRKIGQDLGVAHLLEGSVQRAGNRVRVNAQLIDARNDAHLWAQTYDRDLADVFAIQSEIAKAIADQLQAKLSPNEKKAIDLPPTSDLAAFDLYTRAKDLILTANIGSGDKSDLLQGIELLNQAVARDPSFFDAYCQLVYAHGLVYVWGFDHTPARLALAEAAVDAAARLRPDAGETHLARAQNLYQGHLDYDGALAELELARQTLPNDARIYQLIGFIQRRQPGRYEEATRTLEHAIDLDPRNLVTLNQIAGFGYPRLRRYTDAKSAWDRLLAIRPDNNNAKVSRATVDLDWKADTRPLHQIIDSIRATNSGALQSIADSWIVCALAERDAASAKKALVAAGDKPIYLSAGNVSFSRSFVEGVIARMSHDEAVAGSAFTAARTEQEKIVQAQPDYGQTLCVLGLIDAGLSRKEEAIREGRRAIELLPVEQNAPEGADMIKYLAMIAAWVGDKDLACEQLAVALSGPSGITYGELKLLPFWDPLRGDPRFEKIVASLAPKDTPPTDAQPTEKK